MSTQPFDLISALTRLGVTHPDPLCAHGVRGSCHRCEAEVEAALVNRDPDAERAYIVRRPVHRRPE